LGAEVSGNLELNADAELTLYVGGHGQDVGGFGDPTGGGGGGFITGFDAAGGVGMKGSAAGAQRHRPRLARTLTHAHDHAGGEGRWSEPLSIADRGARASKNETLAR
jgi:hypothetical protein